MTGIASALRRIGGTYQARSIERKEPVFEAPPEPSDEATPSGPVSIDQAVASWVREISSARQTRSPKAARLAAITAICILAATIGVSLAGFQLFFSPSGLDTTDNKSLCSEGTARPEAPCVASKSSREPVLPGSHENSKPTPKPVVLPATTGVIPTQVSPAKKPPPFEQKAPAPKSRTASIQRTQSTPRFTTAVPETKPGTIEGWTVREVTAGTAVLDGPRGSWRVKRGDSVPGLGRVDSIVQWGNRWIVATSTGLVSTR
jgi:hypothetical protein